MNLTLIFLAAAQMAAISCGPPEEVHRMHGGGAGKACGTLPGLPSICESGSRPRAGKTSSLSLSRNAIWFAQEGGGPNALLAVCVA